MNGIIWAVIMVAFTTFMMPWQSEVRAADELRDDETVSAFRLLTKSSMWALVQVVKMNFETFHTQGLVKIDDVFYVSAVEALMPPIMTGSTDALYDFSIDRTSGTGRAWLFKFAGDGTLLNQVELTQDILYHPGGIDYDGEYIWVPVSERRPNSNSIIYRVDPETLEAEEVFRVQDHIGGMVNDVQSATLHGVSWGSRRMYAWTYLSASNGQIQIQSESWTPNLEHGIDYQDCHAVGVAYMLCGGLNKYDTPAGSVAFGGIDLVDLSGERPRPEHQIPISEYVDDRAETTLETWAPSDAELVVSNNAFWAEPIENGETVEPGKKLMRFYFMTDRDKQADLLIYEASTLFLPAEQP